MAVKKKQSAEDFETETPYTKNENAIFKVELRKNNGDVLFKTNKKYPIVYETTHVYRMYAETGELWYIPKDPSRTTVE